MKKIAIIITLIVFIILLIVVYSVLGQEDIFCTLTMVYGKINVDGANITLSSNDEITDWQLSKNKTYLVVIGNILPQSGSVLATLTASKQGYISFNETFNISCGEEDLEKNITLVFCDFNGDGIVIHDYSRLMAAYKCFLGIENCSDYYRDWGIINQEYNCFNGN